MPGMMILHQVSRFFPVSAGQGVHCERIIPRIQDREKNKVEQDHENKGNHETGQ
jgi:hypothetical protein